MRIDAREPILPEGALEDGLQVGLDLADDRGVGAQRLVGDLAQAHGPKLLVAELAGDLVGEGSGQVVVGDDHGVEQRGQPRLGLGGGFRLVAQGGPDRRRRLRSRGSRTP